MSGRKKAVIGGGTGVAALVVIGLLVLLTTPSGGRHPVAASSAAGLETSTPASVPGLTTLPKFPFTQEPQKQDVTVSAMDKMGLDEYARLPFADHLAYALAKNPQMAISTPTEDGGFTSPWSIPGYYWSSVGGTALSDANTTEGAKIAAANDYYPSNPDGSIAAGYQASIDSIEQTGGAGVMNSSTLVYVDSGSPRTITDAFGKKIDILDVTYYVGSATETTGSEPTRLGPDKTAQAVRQEVTLLNGSTVVFYPIGYNLEGHVAPDGGVY